MNPLDVTGPFIHNDLFDHFKKGEFKKLMKWRLAIRLEVGLEVRKKDVEDETDKVEIEEDVDEEQVVTEEVSCAD